MTKQRIMDIVAEYDCERCGERATLDVVVCPHTGHDVVAIVYCATCSGGVCGSHGFVALESLDDVPA